MQRQQGDWRRIGLQVGLLAGIGLAFAVGSGERVAVADGGWQCPSEGECTFKKPNIMFILDYSTSMNTAWDLQDNLTAWEVAVATIAQVAAPGGFISQNTHIALMRFGHDPDPETQATLIPNDSSGLVDGQALDIPWDDENGSWHECVGQWVSDSLEATPPPLMGAQSGIGAWTKGALDRAAEEIAQTKADHPEDAEPWVVSRSFVNVVLTQGAWTNADGTMTLAPDSEDPAITAQDLFDNQDIRTYVVSFAKSPQAQLAADELAAAGGTTIAFAGGDVRALQEALADVLQNIINALIAPECVGGLPRVMILLDASSAMLNVGGAAGAMGETGWDQAREVLVGRSSLFDADVGVGTIEDISHIGLAVFGHDVPGEHKLLVQYGPCVKDNLAWALDPQTSCELPGCDDPWGGPPITWTFADGSEDPPGFDHPTSSHMPSCAGATACAGSGAYLHLGLQLIKDNRAEYHAAAMLPQAMYPTQPETLYVNILITEGRYDGHSTDAQVQAELEAMYLDGVTTHVIGLGDGADHPQAIAQLAAMADWGSGGSGDHYDADNQSELEAVLAGIFGNLSLNPCCAINDCSHNPEPTTNEPDPIPGEEEEGDGDGDGDPDTGDGDGEGPESTGDGDGDPSSEDDAPPTDDEDEDTETGESGGDSSPNLNDRGCACRADAGDSSRELPGAGLLLILLGLGRRRE